MTIEFLRNLLIQTIQTKQKSIRLDYLDHWIQVVQFDEQKFNKMYYVQVAQFDELLFCLIGLVCSKFPKNWNMTSKDYCDILTFGREELSSMMFLQVIDSGDSGDHRAHTNKTPCAVFTCSVLCMHH